MRKGSNPPPPDTAKPEPPPNPPVMHMAGVAELDGPVLAYYIVHLSEKALEDVRRIVREELAGQKATDAAR